MRVAMCPCPNSRDRDQGICDNVVSRFRHVVLVGDLLVRIMYPYMPRSDEDARECHGIVQRLLASFLASVNVLDSITVHLTGYGRYPEFQVWTKKVGAEWQGNVSHGMLYAPEGTC
jgi:hypothetical protein